MSIYSPITQKLKICFCLSLLSSTVINEPSVVFHPLGSARARNPGVTTEVIADISTRKTQGEDAAVDHYSAICTLDGQ